ncbi:MAG: glycosyltransferase family 2 protein [Planctomycetaceae bacterium]|nr:glycosyltransferase family 2 protein [Planctomycetaceae bacterium]
MIHRLNSYDFEPAESPADDPHDELGQYHVAVVIPAYNEERHIARVIASVPAFVRHIIVVEDCGQDQTAQVVERIAADDPRVFLVRHDRNQGVGGAMVSGFRLAVKLKAQIVVKMDGDGQMSADYLAELIDPLVRGQADLAKGNRFHDFPALARMPFVRRLGNVALSFLTKMAVGYWTCFDPCNGYVAIRGEVLRRLPLDKLHRSYFFETSLLAQLYLLGAVVADVPMPAIYGDEVSHLSVSRVLVEFPPKLAACLARRLLLKNLLYDFSMLSIFALAAILFLTTGVLYGGTNWILFAMAGQAAPTGTVVIPAMLITLGVQFLLSAVSEDLRAVPGKPLTKPLPAAMTERANTPLISEPRS